MWKRGVHLDGYVANCVESKQIILLKGFTALFVQILRLDVRNVVLPFVDSSDDCKVTTRNALSIFFFD
nr:phosphoinositide phosphatase SAC6 [Tanacetum cinerariifolium]